MPRRLVLVLLACLLGIVALCLPASHTVTATGATDPTLWTDLVIWISSQQRSLHEALVAALKLLKNEGGIAATWSLVLGSFLYGIFHAAGPGHGKAVLTTYLLTHPHRLSQGVGIAALGALCQGVVAILLVYGLIYLADWLPRETNVAVTWSERFSYLLITVIGALLILRITRKVFGRFFIATPVQTSHDHDHEQNSDCGHTHVPDETQLQRINGFFSLFGVVFAIGLRPCTGAVLVLVFAKAIGIPWAGAGGVLAMSAGTSIAVAALAFLAVKFRHKAVSMTANGNPLWQIAAYGVALAGGGLLIALGISLLSASFYVRHPLGL